MTPAESNELRGRIESAHQTVCAAFDDLCGEIDAQVAEARELSTYIRRLENQARERQAYINQLEQKAMAAFEDNEAVIRGLEEEIIALTKRLQQFGSLP